jgi:hypothetical protein
VLIKVADGTGAYNLRPPFWSDDIVGPLTNAFRGAGIKVYGWQYVYGTSAVKEANRAIERVNKFNLDGFVVDAEAEFKAAGKADVAKSYMSILRANLKVPVGLTSYRFPTLHMEFPWKAFLERSDFNMPQVYWQASHNAGDQLERTIREHRALEVKLSLKPLPIYPIGAAYHENGWQPTPAEMHEFFDRAIKLNLPAVSWWEWGAALRYSLENEFVTMQWPGVVTPPPQPKTIEERLGDLEADMITVKARLNL